MVDYSRRVDVKCIKSKNRVKNSIQEYIAEIERESEKRAKRSELIKDSNFVIKRSLHTYFKKLGIKHKRSNVETPQTNNVEERVNRTLLDLTRSMLHSL